MKFLHDFSTDEGLSPKRLELFQHNGTQHSYSRTIFYLWLFTSTSATQLTEIFPLTSFEISPVHRKSSSKIYVWSLNHSSSV